MEILGDSRLPTRAEADELINKCKWEYNDRKKGYKVTGPNGNSIFLPFGGQETGINEIVNKNMLGYFWTANEFNENLSYVLAIYNKASNMSLTIDKSRKHNIRRGKSIN